MTPVAFDQAVKRVLRGEAARIFPQVRVAAGFTPNPIQGYLKPSSTREALQQLLFAGGAWFRIEADGTLTLTPQAIANTTIPPLFEFNAHNKALLSQYLKAQLYPHLKNLLNTPIGGKIKNPIKFSSNLDLIYEGDIIIDTMASLFKSLP